MKKLILRYVIPWLQTRSDKYHQRFVKAKHVADLLYQYSQEFGIDDQSKLDLLQSSWVWFDLAKSHIQKELRIEKLIYVILNRLQ